MTQDLYYYEEGYFTPENYHGYLADAEADLREYAEDYFAEDYTFGGARVTLSCDANILAGVTVEATGSFDSNASETVTVSVIRGFVVSLSSSFVLTGTISNLKGADLFAFNEAALAVQVSRIRDNNILVSSVFSISTDASRTVNISSSEDAVFSMDIINARTRATEAAVDAAFSLDVSVSLIKTTNIILESTLSLYADVIVIIAPTEAEAELLVSSQLSTTAARLRSTTIEADSNISLSVDSSVTRLGSADLESIAVLTADVDVQIGAIEAGASLTSSSNLSAVGIVIITATSSLASNTNLNASISTIFNSTIDCEALFSPSIVCNAITNTFAVLDTTTLLTADNTRSRDNSAGLAVIVLSQVDISIVRNAVIDASSNSLLSNTVNRIQQGNIQCESLFTPNINCVVTVNSFANLETNITVVANNSRTRSFDIDASSSFSIAVDADKIASANIEIFSESALSSIVSKIAGLTADISAQADINSIVYRIKQFSIEETSAFSPSITCNVTVNPFANLESAFSFNINLSKTITFNVDANAQSSLTANTSVISNNSSTMVSQSNLTAVGIRSIRFIATNIQGQIISANGNILQTDLYPNYAQVTLALPE